MIEIRNALGLPIEELASEMTRCFEGYIIPIAFSPTFLSSMLRVDAIDMENTLIAMDNGSMVGILLVCRRGPTMRVGAMAVAKPQRRKGIGRLLIDRAIADASERKDRRMVLEAVEQNEGAIAFYGAAGFKIQFRLLGFTMKPELGISDERLAEIDFDGMASLLHRRSQDACSWASAPATIVNLASPYRAFALDGVGAAIAPIGEETLLIRSLALSGDEDEAKLRAMLAALAERYPGRGFKVPVFFPEPEFKDILTSAGFQADSISQVQMELVLGL